MTTEQRLDSIDSRLVALLTVAEAQQGDITALTENIAAVNHQTELLVSGMGQLLEGITEFRLTVVVHHKMQSHCEEKEKETLDA